MTSLIESEIMSQAIGRTVNAEHLASAMKFGHPVEIFDSIIAEVFWDIQAGKQPEKNKLENLLKGLKRFKRSFKVKELSKPIKDLSAYISEPAPDA
jgi:hypothetical protein